MTDLPDCYSFSQRKAPKSVTVNLWITYIKMILCFISSRRAMLCILHHGLLRNSSVVIGKYTSHILLLNLLLEPCALLTQKILQHMGEEGGRGMVVL